MYLNSWVVEVVSDDGLENIIRHFRLSGFLEETIQTEAEKRLKEGENKYRIYHQILIK